MGTKGDPMSIEPKFGIIVFLDALGARTTDIAFSKDYLSKVTELKRNIIMIKGAIEEVDAGLEIQSIVWNAEQLSFRFFGDSVLIAYEFLPKHSPRSCIDCVLFVVATLVCLALKQGILFRGAISIGKYLQNEEVFLGPAVTDAANWYDQSDMVGALFTPATMNYLKALLGISSEYSEEKAFLPIPRLMSYDVPLSRSAKSQPKSLKTYVVEWPSLLGTLQGAVGPKDGLLVYYESTKNLPVPIGAESKYENTEVFIKVALKRNQGFFPKPLLEEMLVKD
jgi:hypothetical protein